MTAVPAIPNPQAARVNKDGAADPIWYQYELELNRAVKNSVSNTTKVIAGAGLTGGGALTSDVTLALAATTVTPASYGGATKTVSFTVNKYGQLTAANEVVIDLTGLGGVPTTRLINTTAPLTGGGNLSADRTLAITSAALTRTNDTNVTLTLGGSAASALIAAASLTLGWTGTLAQVRGGTGADLSATGGTSQVLKQVSAGSAVTVAQLAAIDLSDYAEGTWTPADTSGASLVFTLTGTQRYRRIGKLITAFFDITYPVTADGTQAVMGGLPFTCSSTTNGAGGIGFCSSASVTYARVVKNTSAFVFSSLSALSLNNSNMSGVRIIGAATYPID